MNPMFSVHASQKDWLGKSIKLETGHVARQADGAVMVSYGKARILCTVVVSPCPKDAGFLPLSVHYSEKIAAAGRIPGGFFKRETKPSDREILISRIIDRSIRPFFDKSFYQNIQVICTVYSYDPDADNAFLALIGTSAALGISEAPFFGPVAATRVGCQNNELVIIKDSNDAQSHALDLFVSGTKEGIAMVECGAQEKNKDDLVNALEWAHQKIVPLTSFVQSFVEKVKEGTGPSLTDNNIKEIENISQDDWDNVCNITDRIQRKNRLKELLEKSQAQESDFWSVCRNKARSHILRTKKRLDGRSYQDVRSIFCQTRYLPGCHGSALFTRGHTQALVSVTLSCKTEGQIVETLSGTSKDVFLLHYNFPPFAVGEEGKIGAPGRREVGHGYLARKGIAPVIPNMPCTIRIVSDITESDGSSSMATVCGGCLALFDAGVDLKRSVAGVAMGAIQEGNQCAILSDISGTEDWLGDMDFKVIGTEKGITAIQMDLKGQALSRDFFQEAIDQADKAYRHILNEMKTQSISAPLQDNDDAPAFGSVSISPKKIGALIGTGGKTIRQLCDSTGSKIDIEESGMVSIMSSNQSSLKETIKKINQLVQEPEIGKVYTGKVVSLRDFGAFVDFGFEKDGLVHISEVHENRSLSISDVLSEGQNIKVKVIEIDSVGRVKLTHKGAD